MKKTIIINQRQLDEVLGANSAYLDAAGREDFREYPGNEVSAEANLSDKDGEPIKGGDEIANSMAVKDGFWRTRGAQRGGIGSLNCSREHKKKVMESNSELEGQFFRIDPTTFKKLKATYMASKSPMDAPGKKALGRVLDDGGMEYTNATTLKSRMDNLRPDTAEYQDMGGKVMHRFLTMTLGNATGMISADKRKRYLRGDENVYQKAGGTKQSGNGKAHVSSTENIIMK